MAVRKLFVSHSSRSEADRQRLKDICAGLRAKGYHTLVDQSGDIPVGSDWDLYLSEWMAECHAAIILFTKDALHSKWVQKEAAILTWRARVDPTFVLIGALMDGMTPETIDKKKLYRILRITDIQLRRECTTAADVVATANQTLGGPETDQETPFDDLERRIRDILEQVAEPQALKDAWDRLPGTNKPLTAPAFRFAPAFARYILRDPQQALGHLHCVLESLAHLLGRPEAEQLRTLVLGIWVEAEAATRLADTAIDHNVVALNGARVPKFSGRAYCERAWPYPRVYKLVPVNTREWAWQEIERAIETPFADASDPFDDPKQNIEDYPDQVVILIASKNSNQPPDHVTLTELKTHYPKAIVLYWPGPQLPADLPEGIAPLEPELDLREEKTQYEAFNKIGALIAERSRG